MTTVPCIQKGLDELTGAFSRGSRSRPPSSMKRPGEAELQTVPLPAEREPGHGEGCRWPASPGPTGARTKEAIRVLISSSQNRFWSGEFEMPCAWWRPVGKEARLPVAAAAHSKAGADGSTENVDAFSGHILLVEDDDINRRVASSMLERMGLTFRIAEDGLRALEAIEGRVLRSGPDGLPDAGDGRL